MKYYFHTYFQQELILSPLSTANPTEPVKISGTIVNTFFFPKIYISSDNNHDQF